MFAGSDKITINNDAAQDALNILCGAYAPLSGFLRQDDFLSVMNSMRLSDGSAWSLPVVLDIGEDEKAGLKNGGSVILADEAGKEIAVLEDIEIYDFDKREFLLKVYGTDDVDHPGVREAIKMKNSLVGGELKEIRAESRPFGDNKAIGDFYFTPSEVKKIFADKGWRTVAAFQTRNVPHRSHEFLQKLALSEADGLFIQPVIGKKKSGDFKDEVILEAYKILMEKYCLPDKSFLSVLPIRMRYAGPREAVAHALIRKNYGASHMIIGRDHAGAGGYYNPRAAHEIFSAFTEEELGIKILKYENVSHCRACGELRMDNACAHGSEHKFGVSGTKLREMIKNGQSLPEELVRPEISEFLLNHPDPFVN